jgi:hypothetical protein
MRLGLRGLAWLFPLVAVGCFGVADGGHCLNPQPDLPCNSATDSGAHSAGASSAAGGSGPIVAPSAGGGPLDLGKGGSPGSGSNDPSGEGGEGSEAAAGESSVAGGAGGEAGSIAGSDDAGAGATGVVF